MTADMLALLAARRLAPLRRRVPREDLLWIAERVIVQRRAEHPELARLPAQARAAVWESWADDLAVAVAARAAAL